MSAESGDENDEDGSALMMESGEDARSTERDRGGEQHFTRENREIMEAERQKKQNEQSCTVDILTGISFLRGIIQVLSCHRLKAVKPVKH